MKYEIRKLGVGEILDQSIKLIKDQFGLFLGILSPLFVAYLILGFMPILLIGPPPSPMTNEAALAYLQAAMGIWAVTVPLTLLLSLVITPLINAALVNAIAKVYLQQPITVGRAFQMSVSRIVPLLWTWFLMFLAIFGGMILCLVPGILAALWFSMAKEVVVLEGLSGFDALKRSRVLMKNNIGTLIVLGIVLIFIGGGAGAIAQLIPQPHVKVLAEAFANVVVTLLGSATSVLFYFSARCQHEAFDLTLLAESVGTAEPLPVLERAEPGFDSE